jgi:hypothetical protein
VREGLQKPRKHDFVFPIDLLLSSMIEHGAANSQAFVIRRLCRQRRPELGRCATQPPWGATSPSRLVVVVYLDNAAHVLARALLESR